MKEFKRECVGGFKFLFENYVDEIENSNVFEINIAAVFFFSNKVKPR